MLTDTITKMENVCRTVEEPGYATYIPSELLLIMAIEDGWKIANVECMPTGDDPDFYYTVTLKSRSGIQSLDINLPQITLIGKILEQQKYFRQVHQNLTMERWIQ